MILLDSSVTRYATLCNALLCYDRPMARNPCKVSLRHESIKRSMQPESMSSRHQDAQVRFHILHIKSFHFTPSISVPRMDNRQAVHFPHGENIGHLQKARRRPNEPLSVNVTTRLPLLRIRKDEQSGKECGKPTEQTKHSACHSAPKALTTVSVTGRLHLRHFVE